MLVACTALLRCGGSTPTDTTPPAVTPVLTTISVSAPTTTVAAGKTLQLTGIARDQLSREMPVTLSWSTSAPSTASVSASGLVTGIAAGAVTLTASSGAVSGSVSISVMAPIVYVAGQSYFGRNGYIEYMAGDAPVILTAPHGGSLVPTSIPDRTAAACGGAATTVTDANTADLVRTMRSSFFAKYGRYPHVIISLLSRRKLDPNRVSPEAACGNQSALDALNDWHEFVDVAKTAVLQSTGKGWYMDMHGHGHDLQRLELGYLLSDTDIDRSDATLDAAVSYENTSSIRTLSQFSPLSFSALLRGPSSLGTLYTNNGFPSVPSAADPRVAGTEYFNGGDNTARHGCGAAANAMGGVTNGNICGVQIEANFTGVRDNATNRTRFADATAIVLEEYLRVHWNIRLQP